MREKNENFLKGFITEYIDLDMRMASTQYQGRNRKQGRQVGLQAMETVWLSFTGSAPGMNVTHILFIYLFELSLNYSSQCSKSMERGLHFMSWCQI